MKFKFKGPVSLIFFYFEIVMRVTSLQGRNSNIRWGGHIPVIFSAML